MSNCLVLGASGFIGSHIVKRLLDDGHKVRCYYRNKNKYLDSLDGIETIQGDISDMRKLDSALDDIDYVFHLVSATTPLTSDDNPMLDIDTNVRTSIELFELCVSHNIKRLIFASSGGSIYGEQPSSVTSLSEEIPPHPFSPYAIGKLTAENYLSYFSRKYNMDYVVLRISNPYGPGQKNIKGQGVIGVFLEQVTNNKKLTIYGDGSMTRDYIFIDDLAKIVVRLFNMPLKYHVYNIGSGIGHTVNEITEAIEKVTEKRVYRTNLPTPRSFVEHSVLDTARLKDELGAINFTPLEEGIKTTWRFLNNENSEQSII